MSRIRSTSVVVLFIALITLAGAAHDARADGFAKVGTFAGVWERMMRDARAEATGGALQSLATGPLAIQETAAPLSGAESIEIGYSRFAGIIDDLDFEQLGLTGRWNSLRLSLLAARMNLDAFEVRTAYNPEGTGEFIETENNFVMANLAWDLPLFGFDRSRAWSWTVGATARRHLASLDESTWTAWDMDLGLTGRWLHRHADGWVRVTGTALLRNPFEQEIDLDERSAVLPRFRNLGAALTWAQDLLRNGRNDLVISIGLSATRDYSYDQGYFGELRTGFEIGLADLVSLRAGSDDHRTWAGEQSWGAGLSLPAWVSPRYLLRYDYAHLSDNDDWEGQDHHTFTAGLIF